MTEKRAITAIGDSKLESFIASALIRLGWQVIHRALSFADLEKLLGESEESDVVLFFSSDIKGFADLPAGIKAIDVSSRPANDYELSELVEKREQGKAANVFRLVSGIPIVGVGSFGRHSGASTIALNLAQESALKGVRTLLIDAHSRNPFAADYFAIFGLNRKAVEISENLSIVETSSAIEISSLEISVESIDLIVIECGDVWQPEQAINGRRSADAGFSWIAHNADELFIVATERTFLPRTSVNPFAMLESVAMKPRLTYICNQTLLINKATKERLATQFTGSTKRPVSLFPTDTRGISAATRDRSTLAYSAAKSPLRREILALCDSRGWWRT
jgi:hypothetical protein